MLISLKPISGANLLNANLSGASFYGANLLRTKVQKTIILNLKDYRNLTLEESTKFNSAVTDDMDFIKSIESNIKPKNMLNLLKNKEDLIRHLKKLYSNEQIERLVKQSKFA